MAAPQALGCEELSAGLRPLRGVAAPVSFVALRPGQGTAPGTSPHGHTEGSA